ncbi:MAG: ABC transporter permease [Hyphomicrobiaceae bacterium]|nr:ABC transporter permease [Hyphomicrobiaceae bacterium]
MTIETSPAARPSAPGRIFAASWFGPLLAAILMYLFFAVTGGGKGFLTVSGTAGWLNTAAELGIIAIPIGLLMIAGEFDLSTGSVVGAASIIVAVGTGFYGLPIALTASAAVLLGIGVGSFNAFLVNRTRLPSFIVTLASNFLLAGSALGLSRLIAGSSNVSLKDAGFLEPVLATKAYGFNISIVWWLLEALLGIWVLQQTRLGNWIFATGGNLDGARRAGVPVSRVKLTLFIWTSVSAAFVGTLQAVAYNSGNAVSGQGYVFQTAIAAVIGGVLLTGGFGSVPGIVFGTMIYGIVSLGLFYTGWPTDWLATFIGGLLVVAVLTNNLLREAALRRGRGRS